MVKTCRHCSTSFEISPDDLAFYEKVSPTIGEKTFPIPPPTLCPDCRLQRRISFRNERWYYRRACGLTKKPTLSIYHPEEPFPVYVNDAWWGDGWDGLSYGHDFNFNKAFFEQFRELQKVIPRMAMQQSMNENSEYTNYVSNLKNCYMISTSDFDQDCYYGFWIEHCRDCVDNFLLHSSERSYGCIFCQKIFNCRFAYFSSNCSDCSFIADCRNCRHCTLCTGLRRKEYCFENVQRTREEWEEKTAALKLETHSGVERARERMEELSRKAIHPPMRKQSTVIDSTGDFLSNVEHCIDCYEMVGGKDCKFVLGALDVKDAYDCCYANAELAYENCECFPLPHRSCFNLNCYTGSNLLYCDMCMSNCRDCFGCIGLKHAQYCILNKQYTKEQYEELVPKITEHMRTTEEWGEYFPVSLSPFAYNETEAFDAYPLDQKEVLKRGWRWREVKESLPDVKKVVAADKLPDSIDDIPNDILQWAVTCPVTKRPFKIIKQELAFYRDMRLPVPRLHSDERHRRRMALRNPRKLWKRTCNKCRKEIQTSYAPDRPEKVFCEECYLAAVY